MFILPFKRTTLETNYSNEKIYSKLNSMLVGPPRIIEGISRYKQTIEYQGKIQDRKFIIKRRSDQKFQLVHIWIFGQIENSAERTRINIWIRPNWFVLLLCIIIVSFGVYQIYLSSIQTEHRKGEFVIEQKIILTLGFLVSFIALMRWSAYDAISDLKERLKAEEKKS